MRFIKINIEGDKIIAIFQRRINRFVAEVLVDGNIENAHVANTGRMGELLINGAKVILRKVNNIHRKTQYDLLMVYKENTLISIDSKIPNKLLEEAFTTQYISYFKGYTDLRREVTFGNSKFDFYISNKNQSALIEAKCVTLVKENNLASFPDAPTTRGTRHVLELIEAKQQGFRAAVFFIIQRDDGKTFTPNREMDPDFYDAVKLAKVAGVEFYVYNCKITENSITLNHEVKFIL